MLLKLFHGRDLGAMLVIGAVLTGLFAGDAAAQEKTVRAVMNADLRALDPFSRSSISVQHAYMVYDTLFNIDAQNSVQPQLVKQWSVSEDGLVYSFTLREGQVFSSGEAVRPEDAVASIKRWAAKTGPGKASPIAGYQITGPGSFTVMLSKAFPYFLECLGDRATPVFVMREADVSIPDTAEVTTAVGSGPFLFQEAEWAPGSKVVYTKNSAYKPREEASSGFAGGHKVNVDRVEWLNIPDAQTRLAALENGEIDMIEEVLGEDLVRAKAMANVAVTDTPGRGDLNLLVLNHLAPPLDKPEIRQALLYLLDPEQVLIGASGNRETIQICRSFYNCGSPYATDAGAIGLEKPNVAKAEELLAKANYKGEPIVLMAATDKPHFFNASQVVFALLKQAPSLNVKLEVMDWGSLGTRRALKVPVSEGGWSMFVSSSGSESTSNPFFHFNLRTGCDGSSWFGWPCDREIEKMRLDWASISDPEERRKAAVELQKRWFQFVPIIPFGVTTMQAAYRSDRIKDVVQVTSKTPFWGMDVIE